VTGRWFSLSTPISFTNKTAQFAKHKEDANSIAKADYYAKIAKNSIVKADASAEIAKSAIENANETAQVAKSAIVKSDAFELSQINYT
jgi:hypothetical protein